LLGLPDPELVSMGMSAAALAAFAIAARRNRSPLLLPAWSLVILYLLNYHAQFYLTEALRQSPENEDLLRMLTIRPIFASPQVLDDAVRQFTLGFCVLCLALTGWIESRRGGAAAPAVLQGMELNWQSRRVLAAAYLVSAVLIALLLPVQAIYNIGSLVVGSALDFRLGGMIYHTLVTFVPVLLLTVHLRAMSSRLPGLAWLSLGTYLALAIFETAILSSRGYVLLQMLQVVLLYLFTGLGRRRVLWLGAATVAGGLLLYPVITSIRTLRSNLGYSTAESIAASFSDATQGESQARSLILASSRFIGYTSFLLTLTYASERFPLEQIDPASVAQLKESAFTRWYTEAVAGYGAGVRGHYSSPGLLGAAAALGGPVAVALLPALFALAAQWIFERMARRRWALGPVAPVAILHLLLFLFNEGTFDILISKFVLTAGSLAAAGAFFHWLMPKQTYYALALRRASMSLAAR
jgi:hypothetical protein